MSVAHDVEMRGEPPEVTVTGGRICGVREGPVRAWRGIPYAAPPVGQRRFRAPEPVIPWSGIRDTSTFGDVAVQAYHGQFTGVGPGVPSGEDCLSINVIAPVHPRSTAAAGMPVMVFIHGGGYSSGSSRDFSGQGRGFVRGGRVIYVSFNYRLGALGYLDFSRYSTDERRIDSNLGLRDQVAALAWVRTNIAAFGGNPDNVTIFGESAGGNAVTTLLATPAAKGLFARAIAQSSPGNAVYSSELSAKWAAEYIEALRARLRQTGSPLADESELAMLDGTPATELVTAALSIQMSTPDAYPGSFCLAPVIDGSFLPEHPIAAFRAGRAHRVPLIIGTNDREGSAFRGRVDILPRSPRRIRVLIHQAPVSAREPMRKAYPDLPARRAAADFAGDYAFWYPSVKIAELHSRFAPVYCYRFDVAPRLLRFVGLDATHGIEMYALFDETNAPFGRAMVSLGGRVQFASAGKRMRINWLRFACGLPLTHGWPQYDEKDRFTCIIGEVDRIESDPRGDRRRAWDAFLPLPAA